MALAGRQWVPPAASLAAGAAQVARQERLRVTGDLYWVSAPMTDLARHAAPRLPTRNLYAHDLPSRTGFMVFETPLAAYVNSEGREVQIAAVSWGPWDGPASQWDHGGIWLTFYSHPAPLFPRQAFTGGTADPAFLAPLIGTVPPVLPDNEAGWPFGELSDSGQLPDGTTAQWALTVRAGWRLMRQPLAQETAQPAGRAARRRLARAGLPDSGVRVIHIRRRDHGPARSAGTPAHAAIPRPVVGRRTLADLLVRPRTPPPRGPVDRPLSRWSRRQASPRRRARECVGQVIPAQASLGVPGRPSSLGLRIGRAENRSPGPE